MTKRFYQLFNRVNHSWYSNQYARWNQDQNEGHLFNNPSSAKASLTNYINRWNYIQKYQNNSLGMRLDVIDRKDIDIVTLELVVSDTRSLFK